MPEIDFISAFALLLRDGKLRDVFATDAVEAARRVHLREADAIMWSALNPADLEFQADVLLRKRLDIVKYFMPETCRRLKETLWPTFRSYARVNWPLENSPKSSDAFLFCSHLHTQKPGTLAVAEWNRLKFAHSKRLASFNWVELPLVKRSSRRGLQFFLRGSGEGWRECHLYISL